MKIGVQCFTIRDYCETTEGLAQSLKRVADMGFTTVQLSGVCDYDYAWMRDQLKQNGLSCGVTHTNADRLFNDTDNLINDHKTMGSEYIGIGGIPGFIAEGENSFNTRMKVFADKLAPVIEKTGKAGMKFMYHNHFMEFEKVNGKATLDLLLDKYNENLVGITLDTYWVQHAGENPVSWIKKLKGRLDCVHFKDMNFDHSMAPVGHGNLDFEAIINACADSGVKYAYIEQDDCNGEDPFDCLKKSFDYLKSVGLD